MFGCRLVVDVGLRFLIGIESRLGLSGCLCSAVSTLAHTCYMVSFLRMYYDGRNGESVWKWQLANAVGDFEKKGSGES